MWSRPPRSLPTFPFSAQQASFCLSIGLINKVPQAALTTSSGSLLNLSNNQLLHLDPSVFERVSAYRAGHCCLHRRHFRQTLSSLSSSSNTSHSNKLFSSTTPQSLSQQKKNNLPHNPRFNQMGRVAHAVNPRTNQREKSHKKSPRAKNPTPAERPLDNFYTHSSSAQHREIAHETKQHGARRPRDHSRSETGRLPAQ